MLFCLLPIDRRDASRFTWSVEELKLVLGYCFLLLIVYQRCLEFSTSPSIGAPYWCSMPTHFLGQYAVSMVLYLIAHKVIAKLCNDIYIQDVLQMRDIQYSFSRHLAHLISSPLSLCKFPAFLPLANSPKITVLSSLIF